MGGPGRAFAQCSTRAFRAKRELQCIFLGKKAIIITSKHGTTISFSHYNLFLVNTVRVYRIVLIYGQPKYCYEKTIHVVLNQLCSSLWTSRFWFLIFWLIRFLFQRSNVIYNQQDLLPPFLQLIQFLFSITQVIQGLGLRPEADLGGGCRGCAPLPP